MDFTYKIENGCAVLSMYKEVDKNVVVPSEINNYKVIKIGNNCFFNSDIESIEIPEGIIEIGDRCFWECWNLRKVKLPKSLKRLGYLCFKGAGIEEIEIPEGVEWIDYCCFEGCESLKKIKLPDNLCKIGGGCFGNCLKLSEIKGGNIDKSTLYDAFLEACWIKKMNNVLFPKV